MAAITINVRTKEGATYPGMMAQFAINEHQQVCVLGLDSSVSGEDIMIAVDAKTEFEYIGKLAEHGGPFQLTLTASLREDGWNFLRYSNPLLFMLQAKQTGRIIIPNKLN